MFILGEYTSFRKTWSHRGLMSPSYEDLTVSELSVEAKKTIIVKMERKLEYLQN